MIAEYARALPFGLGERVYKELQLARFIGKLAVDQGLAEMQQRLVPAADTEAPVADDVEPPGHVATVDPANEAQAPSVAELALPDYDQLPAAHIVPMLAGLESDELASIERYERATRQRRTVLARIEQLSAG
ncbi:MAG: hypothetical protein AAGF73_12310 [Actinomycetota bacterium]